MQKKAEEDENFNRLRRTRPEKVQIVGTIISYHLIFIKFDLDVLERA